MKSRDGRPRIRPAAEARIDAGASVHLFQCTIVQADRPDGGRDGTGIRIE